MRGHSLFVFLVLLPTVACPQTRIEPRASKFIVETPQRVVVQGAPVELTIKLSDAGNQLRPTRSEIVVDVTVKTSDGVTRKIPVTFKPGEGVKQVPLTIDRAGIVDITVTNPEFLDGGIAIRVRAEKPSGSLAPPRGLPALRFGSLSDPRPDDGPWLKPFTHRRTGQYSIELKKSPDREMQADGKDEVEISAFVVDEEDEQDDEIRIRTHQSGGVLEPERIRIPKRTEVGVARLVSPEPGEVAVTFMSAHPAALVKGARALSVTFVPAVADMELTVSPRRLTLFESAVLEVTLHDAAGGTLATHKDRQVSLSLPEGRGEVAPRDIVIPAQGFTQRASVRPTAPGSLVVSARSPNLRTVRSLPIEVVFPLVAVALTLAGGASGGWLSFLNERFARPVAKTGTGVVLSLAIRGLVGAVAGLFLFYLALQGLAPALSSRYLAASIGQLLMGFLGGWVGPSVFDLGWALFKRS